MVKHTNVFISLSASRVLNAYRVRNSSTSSSSDFMKSIPSSFACQTPALTSKHQSNDRSVAQIIFLFLVVLALCNVLQMSISRSKFCSVSLPSQPRIKMIDGDVWRRMDETKLPALPRHVKTPHNLQTWSWSIRYRCMDWSSLSSIHQGGSCSTFEKKSSVKSSTDNPSFGATSLADKKAKVNEQMNTTAAGTVC